MDPNATTPTPSSDGSAPAPDSGSMPPVTPPAEPAPSEPKETADKPEEPKAKDSKVPAPKKSKAKKASTESSEEKVEVQKVGEPEDQSLGLEDKKPATTETLNDAEAQSEDLSTAEVAKELEEAENPKKSDEAPTEVAQEESIVPPLTPENPGTDAK